MASVVDLVGHQLEPELLAEGMVLMASMVDLVGLGELQLLLAVGKESMALAAAEVPFELQLPDMMKIQFELQHPLLHMKVQLEFQLPDVNVQLELCHQHEREFSASCQHDHHHHDDALASRGPPSSIFLFAR